MQQAEGQQLGNDALELARAADRVDQSSPQHGRVGQRRDAGLGQLQVSAGPANEAQVGGNLAEVKQLGDVGLGTGRTIEGPPVEAFDALAHHRRRKVMALGEPQAIGRLFEHPRHRRHHRLGPVRRIDRAEQSVGHRPPPGRHPGLANPIDPDLHPLGDDHRQQRLAGWKLQRGVEGRLGGFVGGPLPRAALRVDPAPHQAILQRSLDRIEGGRLLATHDRSPGERIGVGGNQTAGLASGRGSTATNRWSLPPGVEDPGGRVGAGDLGVPVEAELAKQRRRAGHRIVPILRIEPLGYPPPQGVLQVRLAEHVDLLAGGEHVGRKLRVGAKAGISLGDRRNGALDGTGHDPMFPPPPSRRPPFG